MVRDTEDGKGHFLHSKESVTQGDPLAMIAYCIGVLPLIRELREAYTYVTQPWYVDDAGVGGAFDRFQDIQVRSPPRGYFLDPTKSILVVAEKFFQGMGVKIVKGSQYLGGYIGDGAAWRSGWTRGLRDRRSP